MHFGSLVRLDLNEVIALLALLGGLVQTGRPHPSALTSIDAAGTKKVHRIFRPCRPSNSIDALRRPFIPSRVSQLRRPTPVTGDGKGRAADPGTTKTALSRHSATPIAPRLHLPVAGNRQVMQVKREGRPRRTRFRWPPSSRTETGACTACASFRLCGRRRN